MNTRNNTRLIQKKDLIEFWGRDFVYKEKLKFFLFQQEELKKKLPLVDTYQGATVFVSLHGRRQLMPLYAECGLLKIKNFRGDILAIAEKSGSGLFFYYQEDFVEMYFKRYKSICQHSAKDVIVDYLYFNDDSIRGYEYKQIILRDKKFAFIQDMLSMMFNILDYKYVIKELKACRVKKTYMQSQAVQVKNSIQKIVFEEDRAVRYLVTYNKVFKTSLEYFYTYTNQKSVIPLNKNKNIFGIQNKVEISFLQEESRDRGSCMFYKGQVFLSKFDKQKFLFFKKSGYDGDFSYLAVKCMHRNNDVLMKNKFNVSGFSGLEKLLLTGEAVEFVFCMLLCIVSVSIIGGIFFGIKKGRKMLKKIK